MPSRGDAKLPLALDCLEKVEVKWVKWLEVGDANSGTRLSDRFQDVAGGALDMVH